MNELAKALKIEENYLNKIINKKSIKDKHIQVNKFREWFRYTARVLHLELVF